MPEIESDDEYRSLRELVQGAPPSADQKRLRRAQSALLRYESLNPQLRDEQKKVGVQDGLVGEADMEAFHEGDERVSFDAESARAKATQRAYLPKSVQGPLETVDADAARFEPGGDLEGGVDPEEDVAITQRQVAARQSAEVLPSASKNPMLYRPAELIQKPQGIMDALPDMVGFGPVRGKVKHFFEPSVETFKQQQAPALVAGFLQERGIPVNPQTMQTAVQQGALDAIDDQHPAYQAWADLQWATEYDAAKQEGRSVVRNAYMNTSTGNLLGDTAGKIAQAGYNALDTSQALTSGFLGGLLPGADTGAALLGEAMGEEGAVDTVREQRARNPVTRGVGLVAGAIHPASLGSKMAGSLGKVVGATRPFTGALVGGSGSAIAEGALGDAAELGADAALGRDVEVDPVDVGLKAGIRGAVGGAAGLIGQGVARYAQGRVDKLRDSTLSSSLPQAESAGYETSTLEGMKRPPDAERAVKERGLDNVYDRFVDEVKSPMAQAALDIRKNTEPALEKALAGYYAATDNVREAPREVVDELFSSIRGRRRVEGEVATDSPFWENRNLRKMLTRMVDLEITDAQGASNAAQREGANGTRVLTPEDLRDLGISDSDLRAMAAGGQVRGQIPDWFEGVLERVETDEAGDTVEVLSAIIPANARFVMRPAKVNPREFDSWVAGIDRLAGADSATHKGASDPAFDKLTAAVRRTRDRFPAHRKYAPKKLQYRVDTDEGPIKVSGFSAMKTKHAEQLRANETLNERAGLPRRVPNAVPTTKLRERTDPAMNVREWETFENALRSFRRGEGRLERDKALMTLAQHAETELGLRDIARKLNMIPAVRAGEDLRESAQLSAPLRLGLGRMMPGAAIVGGSNVLSLRADPLFRALKETPNAQQLISPELRELLRGMRRDPVPQRRIGLGGQVLGMGGGQVGARVGAGLVDEDYENLVGLIKSLHTTPTAEQEEVME